MAVTPIDAGRIMPLPKGEYNASTPYEILDIVTYDNSLYMASQSTTGNLPTNTTYWVKLIEGIIVDSALSSSSTNPLQNKVVKSELDKKANTSSLGTAASKNSTTTVTSGSDALPTGDAVNTAIANAISAIYKPSGSVAFASLPTLSSSVLGNVYNVTDAFTTTSDFIEGAGKSYPAGTNVVVVQPTSGTYKFDVLSGFVDLSNYIQKSLTSGLIKNDGTIDTNTYLTSQDITGKADKVTSATNGNFAGLDSNGNLTDSGSKASDFLTSSSLTNYVTKSETAGLIKNDGTIDTTSYAKQSEMSVTNGTGTDADKTTIQLKSGTSATVLKSHQDISGKANKTETVSTVGWDSTNKKIIQTINNVLYDVVTGETILNNLTQSQVTTALGYTPCDSSDLGTAASKDVATSGDASNTQVVMGNDSRLSDARTPSNDSNLVHKTGNETIDGNKTFNDDIIINNSDDDNLKSIKFITSESSVPQIQAYGNSLNFENADDYNFDGEVYINNTTHINGELLVNYLECNNGNYVGLLDDINLDGQGIIGPVYYFNFSPYKSYEVGDYCYYNGVVYKCTTAHTGAWNSSHFKAVPNSILLTGDIVVSDGNLYVSGESHINSIYPCQYGDELTIHSGLWVDDNLYVNGHLEVNGSDYAEKFETLEKCPNYRFVTLEGEKIKLAQSSEDYILGIISENPSIIGDKDNSGVAVGLLGKLWVEQDGTAKINDYVTTRENGIATKADSGYRVMKTDGNKILVLFR